MGVLDLDRSVPLEDVVPALLSVKELFLLSGTGCLLVKLGFPGAACLLSEYLAGDVTAALWVSTVMQVSSTNPSCGGSFFFSVGAGDLVSFRTSL